MNKAPSIEELENRMQPGSWSEKGFLGPDESLESIIAQDAETLAHFHISPEQVAIAIEKILHAVLKYRHRLLLAALCDRQKSIEYHRKDTYDYPDLYEPETIPHFSLNDLPDVDRGYLVRHFQVFLLRYRGSQACPWGCSIDPTWNSFDFLILNRNTGESVTGPGLIVHLIRAHHFFEGAGTPFRTDPIKAIRVLELATKPHL